MNVSSNFSTEKKAIELNSGYYDPFSIFQGGFRTDFEKYVIISSLYWKDNNDTLRILKNIKFKYIEEIPFNDNLHEVTYIKLMFVSCQNLDDYRSKVRPLIVQWINSLEKQQPTIPYFIFYFENSEHRTAADRYLKTNIFNKLKTDFPQVQNIFKIKSMFQHEEDRVEVWKSISNATRAVLSDSINQQLAKFKNDPLKNATIYNSLNQTDDALSCFSLSFNSIPYVKKLEFHKIDLGYITTLLDFSLDVVLPDLNNNFMKKSWFLRQQGKILLDNNVPTNQYIRNIGKFAQILHTYINSLEMCYRRNELSHILINRFLNNKKMISAIEANTKSSLEVITLITNLKLLLRNEIIALGISKRYFLKGSMSVIDIQFEKEQYTILNDELQNLMKSKQIFVETIVDYTRELINTYNFISVNMNTLALLTTELALILYYSTEEYETSSEQLVKSYEFFLINGWKYIGIALLEVYIENLDKLILQHGNDVVIRLLSSYVLLAVNEKNNFNTEKFTELCSKLEKPYKLDADDSFLIENISKVYCHMPDVYSIDVKFREKIDLVFDEIELNLYSADNNEIIKFCASNTNLKSSSRMTLSCYDVFFGDFEIDHLLFVVGKLQLQLECKGKVNLQYFEAFSDEKNDKFLKNTTSSIQVPKIRDLNSEYLILKSEVGDNAIKNVELELYGDCFEKPSQDKNYSLSLKHQMEESRILDVEFADGPKMIILSCIEPIIFDPGDVIEIKIPCFFSNADSNLVISYRLSFISIANEGREFCSSHKMCATINTALPIAVAANEIFKSSEPNESINNTPSFFLYSQYTINSVSGDNPVRVHNVNLLGKESLIETWKPQKNVIAFIEQGTTFFFKMSDFRDKSVLLTIDYSVMKEEVLYLMNYLFSRFVQTLKSVNTQTKHDFVKAARNLWNQIDFKYNFYALTYKLKFVNFSDDKLEAVLKYISDGDTKLFSRSVEEFLVSLDEIEIDENLKENVIKSCRSQLKIVVDIPAVSMVTIIEYKFDKKLQYREDVSVKVCLDVFFAPRNETEYEMKEREKKVHFEENHNKFITIDLDFVDYEQKWIIAGVKNLNLLVDLEIAARPQGHHFEFDLTFIPLKIGKLQLPTIEVKNNTNKKLIMEIDYKNTAESVLVVSELNKVIHSF